jgi:hypothetical protein
MDFEADFDDWRIWATSQKIDPLIVAFLSFRRALLFDMKGSARCFPSPRSWEMASDTLKLFKDVAAGEDVLEGIVGEEACIEFFAFLSNSKILEVVEKILRDPERAKLPEQLDLKFALISYLAARISEEKIFDVTCILLRRFEPEVGIMLIRDIARLRPRSLTSPAVKAFIQLHKADISL